MTVEFPSDDKQVTTVTCRYWGGARAAAGVESEEVVATTLAEVLDQIVARRPGDRRFADIVDACAILVGEVPVGGREPAAVRLDPGVSIEFLPPFAGG